MIQYRIVILLALLLGSFSATSQTPTEIFQKFRPSICLVQFYKNISSQAQIGSYIKVKQKRIGLIAREDGLIMVNSDVYPISLDILSTDGASYASGEPSDFKVKLHDGKEYAAEFIGKDEVAQVAFLQITDELPGKLPRIDFRDTGGIAVGEPVYVLELLGESYDFEPLFTAYTINAVVQSPRRKFLIKNDVTALSAGGLAISAAGEAIGITLRVDFDFSFQSPSEFEEFRRDFLEIAPSESFRDLIENPPVFQRASHVGKAWFGIGMQALTPELQAYWKVPGEGGVVIDRVYPESPAEKAGLKVKDVILSFDGEPLKIQRDEELKRFREKITGSSAGKQLALEIFRNGKLRQEKIKLEPAPRAIDLAEKYQLSELGLEVRELTLDILYDYSFPLNTKGVYIYQIDRAAPAGMGGLEVGSIITEVNGRPVTDLAGFEGLINEILAENGKKIMFRVQLRRETQFVFVDAK